MKKWSPCVVVWSDAHGGDSGWCEPNELIHKPEKVTTVGMLFKHDADGVTVVHSKVHKSIGGYTFVPAVNVI